MNENLLDESLIISILEIDKTEMLELVNSIFNEIPKHIEELKKQNDIQKIVFEAHKFRGETASFGLKKLSELFAFIENNKKNISKDEISVLFDEIIQVNQITRNKFNEKFIQST